MLKSARYERKTLTEVAQQELRQAITGGTFRPGSQLPTEAELCEMLGVSRTVVREALRVSESLLQRAALNPQLLLSESIYNLLQTSLGEVIEYGTARLLPVAAPPHIAEKLKLPPNALTLFITQTDYTSGDEPLVYSREYHLPDAFDFVVWRRGPTRLRGSSNDGAQ